MKSLIWLVSICSAIVLTIDARAQDKPNPLVGSYLYRSYCLVCHGVDGKEPGPVARNLDLKPADLSSEQYQTKNVQDLASMIAGYRKQEEAGMPNWGAVLTKTALLDIAAYVSKITQADLEFRGDTRQGRAIFKRACVACHGNIGTGRGQLAHLLQVSMMDFTQSENMKKISDDDLLDLIREGKGDYMPSWKGILSDNEIVDVASYVRLLAR
jgi:cbb3-type cytochrome c oxidase subunit III